MLTVADAMTRDRLRTVAPDALVSEAARIATDAHISHLPVTERGALVGIVCICDFEHVHGGVAVNECMNRNPVTVDVDAPAANAAQLMSDRDISCVLAVAGTALRGIVTLRDLHRVGVVDAPPTYCASCGGEDHIRCARRGGAVGYCLDCTRRSVPPGYETGGG